MQLQKIVSIFYKNHPKQLLVISVSLDFTPPIVKPTVKLFIKQKQGYPAKGATMRIK